MVHLNFVELRIVIQCSERDFEIFNQSGSNINSYTLKNKFNRLNHVNYGAMRSKARNKWRQYNLKHQELWFKILKNCFKCKRARVACVIRIGFKEKVRIPVRATTFLGGEASLTVSLFELRVKRGWCLQLGPTSQ